MSHLLSSVSPAPSSAIHLPNFQQKPSAYTCVGLWEEIVEGHPEEIALQEFLQPFHELEASNPSFFQKWGSHVTVFFQKSKKKEAADILESLWCLFPYIDSEIQERISSLMQEWKDQPSLVANTLGVALAYFRSHLSSSISILKDPKISNSDLCLKMIHSYFNTFKEFLGDHVQKIIGCDSSMRELAITAEFGRIFAKSLIDDRGKFNKTAARCFMVHLPKNFGFLPEIYKKQVCTILHCLLKNEELRNLLESIDRPCPSKQNDVMIQLQQLYDTSSGFELTSVHSREAALNALLAYPRQERTNCFIYALLIGLLQHNPMPILIQLKRLIEEGTLIVSDIIPDGDLALYFEETFHCQYASISLSDIQLCDSLPYRFALADIGLLHGARLDDAPSGFVNFCGHQSGPSFNDHSSATLMQYGSSHDHQNLDHFENQHSQHLMPHLITPSFAIDEIVSRQNWTPLQAAKAKYQTHNRLSSFFQNHLLKSLAHYAIYLSDNCLSDPYSPKMIITNHLSTFSFMGQLQKNLWVLSPIFSTLLHSHLFLKRTARFDDLISICQLTNMNFDDVMEIWGHFVYVDLTRENSEEWITSWDQFERKLFFLAEESLFLLQQSSPQADWSQQEAALEAWHQNRPLIELNLKRAAKQTSEILGGTYPDSLTAGPLCLFSVLGGKADRVLSSLFGIECTVCEFKPAPPATQLAAIAYALSSQIELHPNRRSFPMVLCCHTEKGREFSHIYNLLPFNYSLKQLWTSQENLLSYLKNKIEELGSKLSKTILSREKIDLLAANLNHLLPVHSINHAWSAFEPSLLISDPTPETISELWSKNPALSSHLIQLQIELNNIVEMISWEDWEHAFIVIEEKYSAGHSPLQIQRFAALIDEKKQTMMEYYTQNVLFQYGMTLNVGAKMIHNVLLEVGSNWEFNELLWKISALYGFPKKILLGDLNYPKTNELWAGYQYGRNQISFFFGDEAGIPLMIPDITIDQLYIHDEEENLPINMGLKV